jgi:hypothetical protein
MSEPVLVSRYGDLCLVAADRPHCTFQMLQLAPCVGKIMADESGGIDMLSACFVYSTKI